MTFEEALKELKNGKSIRKPEWIDSYSWNIKKGIKEDICFECERILTLEEIMADDWEVSGE